MSLAAFVACYGALTPVAFGPAPPRLEWEAGREAARAGISWRRWVERDLNRFGDWYDGRIRVRVEGAVWFSPGTVARWLGWLSESESWSDEVGTARWAQVSAALRGKLAFAVRLSSYPSRPMLELQEPSPARPAELAAQRFQLEALGRAWPCDAVLLLTAQSRERSVLDDVRWWDATPLGELLSPASTDGPGLPPWRLGEYHAAWWWVEVAQPRGLQWAPAIRLRITSTRRPRMPHWWR